MTILFFVFSHVFTYHEPAGTTDWDRSPSIPSIPLFPSSNEEHFCLELLTWSFFHVYHPLVHSSIEIKTKTNRHKWTNRPGWKQTVCSSNLETELERILKRIFLLVHVQLVNRMNWSYMQNRKVYLSISLPEIDRNLWHFESSQVPWGSGRQTYCQIWVTFIYLFPN